MSETFRVFANLAVTSEGCTALLENGVAEKLCRVIKYGNNSGDDDGNNDDDNNSNSDDNGYSDVTIEYALWTLGNIAGEGREAVDSLRKRGAFASVCTYMIQALGVNGNVSFNVYKTLVWTFSNFVNVSPPLSYRYVSQLVPLLSHGLRINHEIPELYEALIDALWALARIYRPETRGVRFSHLLDEGDNSTFHWALEHLQFPSARTPALRLIGNVAALTDGTPARVFTAPVLARLQWCAAELEPDEVNALIELLQLLSNLLGRETALVLRVFESDLVHAVIARLPAPPRDGDVAHTEWTCAAELSWGLLSALSAPARENGDRVAVATALLNSGAVQFCAQALNTAVALSEAPPDETLNRLLKIVRSLIMVGEEAGAGADSVVSNEGVVEPQNRFLAAFIAADGEAALSGLVNNDEACAGVVDEVKQLHELVCQLSVDQ